MQSVWLDANSIWHRQISLKIADQTDATILLPRSVLSLRQRTLDELTQMGAEDFPLPPGWASKLSFLARPVIRARILNALKGADCERSLAFLTSPAYSRIPSNKCPNIDYVYYCADDYKFYEGWGGPEKIEQRERQLIQAADYCVFVSEALRQRAVAQYGAALEKTFVSPNATEPRFYFQSEVSNSGEKKKKPIVGILGTINHRTNADLVSNIAKCDVVSKLMVIGGVSHSHREIEDELVRNPRVEIIPKVPHEVIHEYVKKIDIAVIPYAKSQFNHMCSPMRLYDHLAAGSHVISTDACDQINESNHVGLEVCPANQVVDRVVAKIEGWDGRYNRGCGEKLYWSNRARSILGFLGQA